MTWPVPASKYVTLPLCNTNIYKDDSDSQPYAAIPCLKHEKNEKLLHLPEQLKKYSGQKRSFIEIEDSICKEDTIIQAPPLKRSRSEDLTSPVNLFAWQVPSFVPILPPTGPTYLDNVPESIFLPALSQIHPDILINQTELYIQHMKNTFLKVLHSPEDISDIDVSKEVSMPTENTSVFTEFGTDDVADAATQDIGVIKDAFESTETSSPIHLTPDNIGISKDVPESTSLIYFTIEDIVISEVVSLAETECLIGRFTEDIEVRKHMSESEDIGTPSVDPATDTINVVSKSTETSFLLAEPTIEYIEVNNEGKVISKGAQLFADIVSGETHHKSTPITSKIAIVRNSTCESTKNVMVYEKRQKKENIFGPLSLHVTCKICNVRCASGAQLTRHMQSHGANRKYKCKSCDCSYSRKDNLIKHENNAHPVLIY